MSSRGRIWGKHGRKGYKHSKGSMGSEQEEGHRGIVWGARSREGVEEDCHTTERSLCGDKVYMSDPNSL